MEAFQRYYNYNRGHESLDAQLPPEESVGNAKNVADLGNYR
ncbi:hypothetical protein [Legionella israelensis]|nr:hypothetical protein [Legionella israelensis]